MGTALNYLREKALSKDEKNLRKAGFKDHCGNWTEEARDVLLETLCKERSDDLAKIAADIVAEQEKKAK